MRLFNTDETQQECCGDLISPPNGGGGASGAGSGAEDFQPVNGDSSVTVTAQITWKTKLKRWLKKNWFLPLSAILLPLLTLTNSNKRGKRKK